MSFETANLIGKTIALTVLVVAAVITLWKIHNPPTKSVVDPPITVSPPTPPPPAPVFLVVKCPNQTTIFSITEDLQLRNANPNEME